MFHGKKWGKEIDKKLILDYAKNSINKIDKFIKDFEPYYTIPVLMKKYLKQNAKIIGFNVDPKFNNCLDGLIILDLLDVPAETIQLLTKELKDAAMLNNLPQEKIYIKEELIRKELITDNP